MAGATLSSSPHGVLRHPFEEQAPSHDPAVMSALRTAWPPPGQLRSFLAGLPERGSKRISRLLRLAVQPPATAGPEPPPVPASPAAAAEKLAAVRATWSSRLWEDGFLLPGGVAEVQRLSGLLPLSPATTLLLLGRDGGGAAATVVAQRGAWVAAYQHDPQLAERMAVRLRPVGRRVAVLPWDPAAPAFRPGYHHHALALEPLGGGASPAALLAAVAAALKPDAQLVLLELVLADAAGAQPQALNRWLELEGRPTRPPDRPAMEAALQAAGFELHVTEDAGPRHSAAVMEGWSRLIGGLQREERATARTGAAGLITEAEMWLLRHRLIASGAIGLLRWHATLRR
jgi:hypothetical protein